MISNCITVLRRASVKYLPHPKAILAIQITAIILMLMKYKDCLEHIVLKISQSIKNRSCQT